MGKRASSCQLRKNLILEGYAWNQGLKNCSLLAWLRKSQKCMTTCRLSWQNCSFPSFLSLLLWTYSLQVSYVDCNLMQVLIPAAGVKGHPLGMSRKSPEHLEASVTMQQNSTGKEDHGQEPRSTRIASTCHCFHVKMRRKSCPLSLPQSST